MNKSLILLLILSFSCFCRAQKENSITGESIPQKDNRWSPSILSPNIGIGIQSAFFIEAGISWFEEKDTNEKIIFDFRELSINLEYTPSIDTEVNQALALKLSYERHLSLITLGADVKPITDFNNYTLLLTPRIGVNIFGLLKLSYGRNFNIFQTSIRNIGSNIITLKILLNHPLSSGYDRPSNVSF